VTKASITYFVVDLVISVALGARIPPKRTAEADGEEESKWSLWKYVPTRHPIDDAPYFFKEIRFAALSISLCFGVARFVVEAVASDVSLIVIAVRVCATALQLWDHVYLCSKWKEHFVHQKLRPYLWWRQFYVCFALQCSFAIEHFFRNFLHDKLGRFILNLGIGIAFVVFYYWGKRFDFKATDMDDDRRLPALRNSLLTGFVLSIGAVILDTYQGEHLVGDSAGGGCFLILAMLIHYVDRRQRATKDRRMRSTQVFLSHQASVQQRASSNRHQSSGVVSMSVDTNRAAVFEDDGHERESDEEDVEDSPVDLQSSIKGKPEDSSIRRPSSRSVRVAVLDAPNDAVAPDCGGGGTAIADAVVDDALRKDLYARQASMMGHVQMEAIDHLLMDKVGAR